MGTIQKRGSSGLAARIGLERHAADWQVIPPRRRLFLQSPRLLHSRVPVLMVSVLAISLAIGIGRVLMHQWWQ